MTNMFSKLSIIFIVFLVVVIFSVIVFGQSIQHMFPWIDQTIINGIITTCGSLMGVIILKWFSTLDTKLNHKFDTTQWELKLSFAALRNEIVSDLKDIKSSIEESNQMIKYIKHHKSQKEVALEKFVIMWENVEEDVRYNESLEILARYILSSFRDFYLWYLEQDDHKLKFDTVRFECMVYHEECINEVQRIFGREFTEEYLSRVSTEANVFNQFLHKIVIDDKNSKKERVLEVVLKTSRKFIRVLRDTVMEKHRATNSN